MKTTTYMTEFTVFMPTPADPGDPRAMAYHIAVVDVIDLEDGTKPFRRPGTDRVIGMAEAEEMKLELGAFVRSAVETAAIKDRDNAVTRTLQLESNVEAMQDNVAEMAQAANAAIAEANAVKAESERVAAAAFSAAAEANAEKAAVERQLERVQAASNVVLQDNAKLATALEDTAREVITVKEEKAAVEAELERTKFTALAAAGAAVQKD